VAQLAISVVGAAVGFYFGGPTGAQIGWAAGSLIGAAVAAPDTVGPRLGDRNVQISSYGAALPITYGGVRIAGNVIWSTDLVENASESSGKGGSATTFSYSASLAVAICDGPISGIRRIWADAKLIYDARPGADSAAQLATAQLAEYFVLYLGDETQLPDPTIETIEGVGNVEPYRGTAYIVFTDLPVADYGNRIPNFSFETTTETASTVTTESLVPYRVGAWSILDGVPTQSGGDTVYDQIVFDGTPIAGSYSSFSAALAAAQAVAGPEYVYPLCYITSTNSTANLFPGGATLDDDPQHITVRIGRNLIQNVLLITAAYPGNPYSKSFVLSTIIVEEPPYGEIGNSSLLLEEPSGTNTYRLVNSTFVELPPDGYPTTVQHATEYPSEFPGPDKFPSVVAGPNISIRCTRTPFLPSQACEAGDPVVLGIAQLPSDPTTCMTASGELSPNYQYEPESGTYLQLQAVTYTAGVLAKNGREPVLRSGDPNFGSSTYWTAAALAAGVSGSYGVDFPVSAVEVGQADFDVPAVEEGSALLSDIVSDLCARAGLAAGQIDVTELTDIVQGYRISRQMTARAAIEPLRMAYYFDAVENGDKVHFIKRGGAVVATIGPDDLGAGEETAATSPTEPRRAQETELPIEVNVAYEVREADYQTGTQQAKRIVTVSQQIVGADLPIVMTDDKAAEVADVLMYDAWQARTERQFATTRKFTRLLPTNVVSVDDGEFAYTGMLIAKTEDGPVIKWTMRDTAAAAYSPNSVSGITSGGGGNAGVRFDGPMKLELMDLPLLSDADDNAGFYAAQSGFRSSYHGGRLYKSPDGVVDYTALATMVAQATFGAAITTLGDYAGGNTVDELNTVAVTLQSGSLETITLVQLLGGGNVCLLGDEIMQFQRATLTGTLTYLLTGLLRARKGTEQHMATHVVGERFVLLNATTIYRIEQNVSDIGSDYYKGVAFGSAIADATAQVFDNTAAALKPLSVSHLYAVDAGGGNYTVQWVRRGRIAAQWSDSIDVPLGEASERYTVEVERTGSVISTATVTSPSATVAAIAGDTVRVFQLSDLVGRGFPAEYTI
jgi:hypothetical protein